MKTNIKNGLFILGAIPVDTASIKIADAETDAKPVLFETGADGMYTVLAETNEAGIVTSLIIDFPEHATWDNGLKNEILIDDESILIKDGEEKGAE